MKIAFVYDAVYPWEKGGAQKRVWELARRLADDHDVHLYGMKYWDGPSVVTREEVTLHGVCEPMELYVEGRRSISQAIKFTKALALPLLREDFDVIDCQEFPYFPCFTSKLHEFTNNSTLVITWYEVWDEYWYDYLGPKGVLGQVVERIAMHLSDTIVPISDYIADDLREAGRTDGITVVPNGVDYDGLQQIPEADNEWDVIYFGRLSEHKNVDLLIKAVKIVSERTGRDLNCGIIGDGPERDALESYVEELALEDTIEFLGFIESDEEVISQLKAATVFVLPSIREGFPNTILEANACGVPSIIVDHPENGSTAVVEHGETGFIAEVSAESIADRLEEVTVDQSLRAELSSGAREFSKRHDWNIIVDELEKVYLNASSRNRRTS